MSITKPTYEMLEASLKELQKDKEEYQGSLKYQRLLELSTNISSIAFWEYDFKSNSFFVNDLYYKFLATSIEEEGSYTISAEKYFEVFVPQDSHQIVVDIIEEAYSKDCDYITKFEYTMRRRDGVILNVAVDCYMEYDKNKKPCKSYGTKYNITAEKNRELELMNEKNRELKSLLSSYDKNVMYSSTDLDGIITDVSDAFCRVSGYKREELIGLNHNIVRHPDIPASTFRALWKELPKQIPFESEVKNLKKDGGFYWVKSFFAPEYDKDGVHIGYTAVRDEITDRKEVESLQKEIIDTQKEVVFRMGSIGESRSKETGSHVKRVAEYSKLFALYYGLNKADAELLKQASPMHDIGKIAIPDDILNKPGKLTDNEMEIMKTHAQLGFDILKGSSRALLNTATIVAHEHHEKWDGSGYPQGLTGVEINVNGRITAIADVLDALGNDRCYKKAWSDEKIFEFFKEQRGKHFEPKLVDIFFDNIDEFLEIRDSLQDVQ